MGEQRLGLGPKSRPLPLFGDELSVLRSQNGSVGVFSHNGDCSVSLDFGSSWNNEGLNLNFGRVLFSFTCLVSAKLNGVQLLSVKSLMKKSFVSLVF
jgi:hypothetical protein